MNTKVLKDRELSDAELDVVSGGLFAPFKNAILQGMNSGWKEAVAEAVASMPIMQGQPLD